MADIAQKMIKYVPVPTLRQFHASQELVRAIMGPIGSSKSSACCMELLSRGMEQAPFEGVRHVRFAIVRKTFPELRDTTLATWLDWCPESVMRINMSPPMRGKTLVRLPDDTMLDMEVIFLALAEEADVDKLRSFELTMVWINEAKEVLKAHLDMAIGRIGRYPAKRHGGPSFRGVIMDTNPCHDRHWWHDLFEIEQPPGYRLWKQPPGVLQLPKNNKDEPDQYAPNMGQDPNHKPAENIDNLDGGYDYYMRQLGGKDREWIRVNLQGFYGRVMEGKPVWEHEYKDELHCVNDALTVMRGMRLIVGIDFGLTPAAAFVQMTLGGQVRVIDEIVSMNMGVRTFASTLLRPHITQNYADMEVIFVTDPAGSERAQSDESTCLQVLAEEGIHAQMAPTNVFTARREAVAYFMNHLTDGQPAFLISGKKAPTLHDACKGGYRFKKLQTSLGERYADQPEKNIYSHIAEALQYACLYLKDSGGPQQGYGFSQAQGQAPGSGPALNVVPDEFA